MTFAFASTAVPGTRPVTAYEPGYWELVCEELCGQGHYTMQGRVIALDSEEYRQKFQGGYMPGPTPTAPTPPTSQPNNVALAK